MIQDYEIIPTAGGPAVLLGVGSATEGMSPQHGGGYILYKDRTIPVCNLCRNTPNPPVNTSRTYNGTQVDECPQTSSTVLSFDVHSKALDV